MTNPLASLRKGLQTLRNQVHERKSRLETGLKAGENLTESDEEWLDGAGNLIDEHHGRVYG